MKTELDTIGYIIKAELPTYYIGTRGRRMMEPTQNKSMLFSRRGDANRYKRLHHIDGIVIPVKEEPRKIRSVILTRTDTWVKETERLELTTRKRPQRLRKDAFKIKKLR